MTPPPPGTQEFGLRKVVQIVYDGDQLQFIAVCDDGSIWHTQSNYEHIQWLPLQPPPGWPGIRY